jgi:UDP-N-acetylmuramoyl-L-alanyl-D-glutamate--2,6-diaminopimelate ligase
MQSRKLLIELTSNKNFFDFDVSALTFDSRTVKEGSVFFALQGNKKDGQNYIAEAKDKGAKLILSEQKIEDASVIQVKNLRQYIGELASRFYGHPTKDLETVCVTGTNGKTSCVESLAQLAHYSGTNCGYLSTIGVSLDGINVVKDSELTTPDSIFLQKTFSEILNSGSKLAALEASSHGLAQKRLSGTVVKTAILTSFSHDHLDYHETIEKYENAKLSLFRDLKPEISIIQIDNPIGSKIYSELKDLGKTVYSVSNKKEADFRYSFIRTDDHKLDIELFSIYGQHSFTINTLSSALASNIICSLAALMQNAPNLKKLIEGVKNLKLPKGRMELIKLNKENYCCIDYAHTPEALECALRELKASFDGKLYCVFGCGGERDRLKRPLMGSIVEKYCDKGILTNDNPRSENENVIFKEILSGVKDPANFIQIKDREEAILYGLDSTHKNSSKNILLVAGKGHETYQEIKNKKLNFNDKEVIFKYLRGSDAG